MSTRTVLAVATGVGALVVGLTGCGTSGSSSEADSVPSSPEAGAAPEPQQEVGSNASSPDVQELRQVETERLEHLVAADVEQAAPLHADDFELIPPPGHPMGRDDYLAAVGSGDLDYLVFEPISDIEVRVDGTSAVMWYESRIDLAAAGMGRFAHDAWHLYYYEKRGGTWQVVREQATAVGGFPPPG